MLCISVVAFCLISERGEAYTANVSYYFEGIDFDLGQEFIDPTVLLVLMGDTLEDLIRPAVNPLNEFVPAVDLSVEYDPHAGIINVVLQNQVQAALLTHHEDFEALTGIPWYADVSTIPLTYPIDADTILLVRTDEDLVYKLRFFQGPDLSLDVEYVQIPDEIVPEPSTFFLLGFGLVSLMAYLRRTGRLPLLILVVVFACWGLPHAVQAQTEEIRVVKPEENTGDGTIIYGEYTCEPGCQDVTFPYQDKTGVLLKAIPDEHSRFVEWRTPVGVPYPDARYVGLEFTIEMPIEGQFKAMPGDTILAVFQDTSEPVNYHVTVTREGSGDGGVSGNGIQCGTICTTTYPSGSLVELSASPGALSLFSHWLVDGAQQTGKTASFVITHNMPVTAVFEQAPPSCLPTYGGIEQCGDGIDNDCDGKFDEGCYDCRTDFENLQCCRDDSCTPMAACEAGEAAVFLGCSNVDCTPMVRCEAAPQGGPCECEIADDGIDNDCDGYTDEPIDDTYVD